MMEYRTKVTVTYAIEGEDTQFELIVPIKGDETTTITDLTDQFTEGLGAASEQVMMDFANLLVRHMFVHTGLDTTTVERNK